jgi:hypothetical protein
MGAVPCACPLRRGYHLSPCLSRGWVPHQVMYYEDIDMMSNIARTTVEVGEFL